MAEKEEIQLSSTFHIAKDEKELKTEQVFT